MVSTFNAFCDEMEGPSEYCKSLNAKMASRTKESGMETTDNTKVQICSLEGTRCMYEIQEWMW